MGRLHAPLPSGRCAVVSPTMGRLHAPLPFGRCAVVSPTMGRLHAPLPFGRCAVVSPTMGRLHAPLPFGRCAVVSLYGSIEIPSRCPFGSGIFGSSCSIVCTRMLAAATPDTHLWSAGTTYHG